MYYWCLKIERNKGKVVDYIIRDNLSSILSYLDIFSKMYKGQNSLYMKVYKIKSPHFIFDHYSLSSEEKIKVLMEVN